MGEGRVRLSDGSPSRPPEGRFRLALVGVGTWGRRYAQTLARRADCQLVAYARASRVGEDVALEGDPAPRRLNDWTLALAEAACAVPTIDGLIVATTPASQAAIARAAVEAGVPAIIEKPLGLDAREAEAVAAVAAKAGRPTVLLVDFIHLWSPAYRALKEAVNLARAQGGRVVSVETEGSNRGPFRTFSSLLDYAPHDLALCLDLVGVQEPFELHDVRVRSGAQGGEIVEADFTLGGVPVGLRAGNGAEHKTRRFAVTLDDGRRWLYDDTQPWAEKLREDDRPLPLPARAPLDELLSDFVAGIRAARGVPGRTSTNLELAVRVSRCLEDIDRRARNLFDAVSSPPEL